MKIDKLLKETAEAKAAKTALEKEVAQLRAEVKQLNAEADAAAHKGDVALYMTKADEAKQKDVTLYVREKQLENMNATKSQEEARDAWAEYAAKYNRDHAKAWAAYEKARRDLWLAFLEIVNEQNDALRLRERCAEAAGIENVKNLFSENNLDLVFPFDLIPFKRTTYSGQVAAPIAKQAPDVHFFFDSNLGSVEDAQKVNQVVRWHYPV